MFSCNVNKQYAAHANNRPFKYYNFDSLLVLELSQSRDSLIGQQCFTMSGGRKTDCCIEYKSIFLKKTLENKFLGEMRSCFYEKNLSIEVEIKADTLIFILINDDHEFLSQKTLFIKTKE